jgi:ribonuclease Z
LTTENKYIHNALKQTHLQTKRFNLSGFSISGLASYHLLPELNFAVDMGECPLTAIPIDHVFLTHAHGDHSRCLMRHHSLRKMMGLQKDAAYYLSEKIYEKACQWIRAEAAFEGVLNIESNS